MSGPKLACLLMSPVNQFPLCGNLLSKNRECRLTSSNRDIFFTHERVMWFWSCDIACHWRHPQITHYRFVGIFYLKIEDQLHLYIVLPCDIVFTHEQAMWAMRVVISFLLANESCDTLFVLFCDVFVRINCLFHFLPYKVSFPYLTGKSRSLYNTHFIELYL